MLSRSILVVAPHPDDETLGCGGTLLKCKSLGYKVYWLVLTNMAASNIADKEAISKRDDEIRAVAKAYQFDDTFYLDYPPSTLDNQPMLSLVSKISNIVKTIMPETILVNNRSDIHTDHQVAFQAVTSCSKAFRYPFIKKILMYEVISETDHAPALTELSFIPNVFIDVSDYFVKKIQIMKMYKSEVMPNPMPRSIQAITALSQYRGSRIGVDHAEAFQLIFENANMELS